MDELMTIPEAIWRSSYQIVVSKKVGASDEVDGSGFILHYRGKNLFVTADHVIHYEDFSEGLRYNKDGFIRIINNVNDEERHQSIQTPIGGFVNYTKFTSIASFSDFVEQRGVNSVDAIPDDMPDVAFAEFKERHDFPFQTHRLTINGQIIVKEGLPKLIINEEDIAEFSNDDTYVVVGCVKNSIDKVKGEWNRYNAVYDNLKLKEIAEEEAFLSIGPGDNKVENWAALSGSPIFNQRAQLVGMLLRISPECQHVVVMPIKCILKYMDMAIDSKQI